VVVSSLRPFDVLYQFGIFVEYRVGKITAVVEDHVQGFVGAAEEQGLFDTPVSLFQGLAFPGEYPDTGSGDGGSGLVLRRKDVTGAPAYFGAQFNQGLDQYGGLNGHVQTACDARAFQGLLFAIFGADGHQAGHFCFSQSNFFPAPFGQAHIFHFIRELQIDALRLC
jgi:hypothetical protein